MRHRITVRIKLTSTTMHVAMSANNTHVYIFVIG